MLKMRYGSRMGREKLEPFAPWSAVDRQPPWVIAGPCCAKSRSHAVSTAREIAALPQVEAFQAGLWCARTQPSTAEGAGEAGLDWLCEVREETGLRIATEIAEPSHVDHCLKAGVDILWISARTTMDPAVVHEIAKAFRGCAVPVMVKNPPTPDLGLWLGAIEHIGQFIAAPVIAVHRGFSAYRGTVYDNHPHWQLPIELKLRFPEIPLVCNPNQIAGKRELVPRVSQMALDLGIHGLMIETDHDTDPKLSTERCHLTPEALATLLAALRPRVPGVPDRAAAEEMARIRSLIDAVDRKIILDLAERFRLVEEIGRVKYQQRIPVLQLARWEDLLVDHLEQAADIGLDKHLVKALFEIIHAKAVEIQL